MNIIKRIWLIPTFSGVVFLIFLIGMSAIVWFSGSASDKLLNISDAYQPILNKISRVNKDISHISELLEDAVITGEIDMLEEAEEYRQSVYRTVESLSKIDDARAVLLNYLVSDYFPVSFKLANNMIDSSTNDDGELISDVVNSRNKLNDYLIEYEKKVIGELRATVLATRDEIQYSTKVVTVFVVMVSIVMGVGTILIVKSTSTQLHGLMNFAKEIEKGNYNFQADENTQGEFSSLVNALNSMVKSIKYSTDQLSHMAHYDSLTGVHNRRAIMDRLESEIRSVRRHGYLLSFCMCDIDKFKHVNDNYGHLVGDQVVCEFSTILKDKMRMEDVIGRYGGDEFCLILPHTSAEDAKIALERARLTIEASKLLNEEGEEFSVTCSFGITQLEEGDDVKILIKKADDALYSAKENGRNTVCIYNTA